MSPDFIQAAADLTENKLFSAVVPVLLGAGLLSWLFKIRDRQVAIRDESLKFVTETADLLNRAISPLFGSIRRQSLDALGAVDKALGEVFEHRLSTRARSVALLGSEEFWHEYDAITWDLRELVDSLRMTNTTPTDAESKSDDRRRDEKEWEPALARAQSIWQSAAALTTAGIQRALRGKRPQFPLRPRPNEPASRLRNQ
jgi:hypothetical protein